jgi:hypothetical protein
MREAGQRLHVAALSPRPAVDVRRERGKSGRSQAPRSASSSHGYRDQASRSNLKRSLANLVKQDIGQLTALVKTRLRRMQYRPGLLEGFLAKPGLDLGNFHN